MNTKEIQDIINFIKKTDLDDVSIETENYKIRVKKNSSSISEKVVHKSEKPKIIEKKETVVEDTTTESITNEEKAGNNIIIKSPMIGTLGFLDFPPIVTQLPIKQFLPIIASELMTTDIPP